MYNIIIISMLYVYEYKTDKPRILIIRLYK